MNASMGERRTGLRWAAIFAGTVLAVATAWTGELLGSLIALIEPGESSAWGWLGGIVTLGMVVVGALVGGYVAARTAGADSRTSGLLHGLLVWGLYGTASATLFAILGGNLALVAGATAGAIRLAIGFAMLALFGALFGAAAGGVIGAGAQPGALLRRGRRWAGGRGEARTARVEVPAQQQQQQPRAEGPGIYTTPADRGDVPPSVH
ncbi:hypothetical protein [Vulgatibacter sp.]|uniref:hypothetical protein n=1 Tax=Vulgatibacter sp. TaxID=1971226 RepID=UPI00356ADAFC